MEKYSIYELSGNPIHIDPNIQHVKDTTRHLQSSLPEALKNLFIGIVVVTIVSIILYLVGDKIDNIMEDSTIKKIILAGIAGIILGFIYFLIIQNFKSFLASLFKPNLKTPEKAVKTYLSSIEKGLYKRAYLLLTDSAQNLDMIKFPLETIMQKEMPDVYFHNLETFENFWSKVRLKWNTDMIRPKSNKTDDSTALIETEIIPTNNDTNYYKFKAEFVLKKIDEYWFLCNGFLWPQTDDEFHKLPVESEA